MQPSPFINRRGGWGLFAVLFVFVVGCLVAALAFRHQIVYDSLTAADMRHQRQTEATACAQAVTESLYACAETIPPHYDPNNNPLTPSPSLSAQLTSRLGLVAANTPGLSLSLASTYTPPSGGTAISTPAIPVVLPIGQFPSYTPPSVTVTPSSDLPGVGRLYQDFAADQPANQLGSCTVFINRSMAGDQSGEAAVYAVQAYWASVPLVDWNVIAYGLPSTTGTTNAPPVGQPPGGSPRSALRVLLVHTFNNEATASAQLLNSANLPYFYRNQVSAGWDTWEYIWSSTYQNALTATASASGALYDTANPNPTAPGLTGSGTSATISLGAVTSQVVSFVDAYGGGSLTITGSSTGGTPVAILVSNYNQASPTVVTFSGNNSRPVILYLVNAALNGNSTTFDGAVWLNPGSSVTGTFNLVGSIAFYEANSFPNVSVYADPSYPALAEALAPISPAAFIASSTGTLQ
jgi:hypothetical protein